MLVKPSHLIGAANEWLRRRGLSLIELLTTIVIMGILTTAAIPLGEVVFIRDKEIELKDILITTRHAIDEFHSDNGRYPRSFDELRWFKPKNRPYLRKSPPINPFASSNQAWIVIMTNCPDGGLESLTLEQFITATPETIADREIYDIQFPSAGSTYFSHQILVYTSLEGTAYSAW